MPKNEKIHEKILREAHQSSNTIHPSGTKIHKDLKMHYWKPGMKRDIGRFVTQCLMCQQVKAEHHFPAVKLQNLPIFMWKWESILMDFIVGLSRSQGGRDTSWVVMDRLIKSAHYLLIHTT